MPEAPTPQDQLHRDLARALGEWIATLPAPQIDPDGRTYYEFRARVEASAVPPGIDPFYDADVETRRGRPA